MKKGFLSKNVNEKGKEKQQPPRINKKDDLDRISGLPKVILHHILSFLDMKQVIQTSLLSRQWRNLWVSLHALNIDDKFWLDKDGDLKTDQFLDFVNKVLLHRDGSNIQEFRLTWTNIDDVSVGAHVDKVCTWVTCAVRRNVQDLRLQVMYMPPLFSFSSSASLKTLRLVNATLPMQVEGSWLGPALENLIIENCRHSYLEFIDISSPRLKYLMVKYDTMRDIGGPSLCKLKICAPNLTSLECIGYMYEDYCLENISSVVTAHIETKMFLFKKMKKWLGRSLDKLLRGLTSANSLTLSLEGVQSFAEFPNLLKAGPISLPKLKYLKLKEWRDNGYIDALAKLFESFSCIETLVVERTKRAFKSAKEEINWSKQLKTNCRLDKLKSVEILNLTGSGNELRFIEFLLKNAMLLENITMTTTEVHSKDGEKKLAEFNMKVQSLPRASSRATILCLQ